MLPRGLASDETSTCTMQAYSSIALSDFFLTLFFLAMMDSFKWIKAAVKSGQGDKGDRKAK